MSRRISERWPDGACRDHVCLPIALLRHAKALGLDDGDLRLLAALEVFRRGDANEAVFPSQTTLAGLCGCSVVAIERRVRKLKRLELIEVERRARPGGARPNHYTRHGLGAALADLEASPSSAMGSEPRTPSRARGSKPSQARVHSPSPLMGEAEVGEQKQGSTHRARDLARSILGLFDHAAATTYSDNPGPFLDLIAARVHEHPEMGIEDFSALIAAGVRERWWSGTPSPRVIFSSEKFEQARQAAMRRRRGRYTRED